MNRGRLIVDMQSCRAARNHRGFNSPCHFCREKIVERFFLSKAGLKGKRTYYHLVCAMRLHLIDEGDMPLFLPSIF